MPILTVNTLGGISVLHGDRRMEDKLSQKSLAIICLLLSAPDARMRKSRVTALLWADSDPFAAKSNLRFNLWSIRKIVGQDEQGEEFILSDRDYIRINPSYRLNSDILAVKAFNKKTKHNANALAHLRAVFQGEYLEGFYLSGCDEYAEIILMERMACQNIQMNILEAIYDSCLRDNNLRGAIQAMGEALHIDPFNEIFAGRILEQMTALNQLTQAIGFYKDFALRLRKNLNIAPSGELQSRYRQLLEAQRNTPIVSAGAYRQSDNLASGSHRIITVSCISGIDYYWMADCIDQLAHRYGDETLRRVSSGILADLAYIYPEFARFSDGTMVGEGQGAIIPDIRLYYALRKFMECVAGPDDIEIVTENLPAIDAPSAVFLKFMEQKPLPRIRFGAPRSVPPRVVV